MEKKFICVVHLDDGPAVLNDLATDRPRVFKDLADARIKLRGHQVVREYGGELFEVGTGVKL